MTDLRPLDDLRPYRASIRRVMRERRCDADEAALRCAAVIGRKHIDDLIARLRSARDQVRDKEMKNG